MSTSPWGEPSPEGGRPAPAPPRPDIVVVGEAEEPPIQTSLDLEVEAPAADPVEARVASVLRALDAGVERTRKESVAEGRRIVAVARDEAERTRQSIEDELVAAHLELELLRARRDTVIQELRELHDLVVATSEQLAADVLQDETPPGTQAAPPPPPG